MNWFYLLRPILLTLKKGPFVFFLSQDQLTGNNYLLYCSTSHQESHSNLSVYSKAIHTTNG